MKQYTKRLFSTLPAAKQIFETLGYNYSTFVGGADPHDPGANTTFLTAYFPCDQPPTVGISYPAANDIKKNIPGTSPTAVNFNILSSEWIQQDFGNNNCSAILAGTNAIGPGSWLIGQPFMQGRYTDFNLKGNGLKSKGLIGFADVRILHTFQAHKMRGNVATALWKI